MQEEENVASVSCGFVLPRSGFSFSHKAFGVKIMANWKEVGALLL
jgi:hypothetical protein